MGLFEWKKLGIRNRLTITNNRNPIFTADGFGIAFNNHITIFGIQFRGVADSAHLLTGNQGAAAAAKGVQNNVTFFTRVTNKVAAETDGLHGGVLPVSQGFVKPH